MGESLGQQYALQVAVQTMKERCLQLQQRLSIVEEENINLRMKYHIEGPILADNSNKTDVETLQQKISLLTKQKSQLTHNVLMVATENRQLWNRLSKLTLTNQTLGGQLTKINDTLNQNPSPTPTMSQSTNSTLIRSKTFTHETPPKLVPKDKNAFLDTSLEDISLKIINSIAQEKFELEKQCAQMTEMQSDENILTSSIGFAYLHDEFDDNTVTEITQNVEKLIHIKDSLIIQKDKLRKSFELLKVLSENGALCKGCKERSKQEKESQKLKRSLEEESPKIVSKNTKPSTSIDRENGEKMCPVCSKMFHSKPLSDFVDHVQNHFTGEDDLILDNFEVISHTTRK